MTGFTYEATAKTLKTDKGTIHYHEAGSGPPLVLIHGSGPGVTGWANFRGNLPVFAEHYRCLIIDLPGYGGSDPVEGIPIPAAAEAVLRFMDGLGIDKAHIIGNSLGGLVGSSLAAQHPGRVNRFVSIGGIGMSLLAPFPAEGINLLVAFTENPSRERLIEWLQSMVFDKSLVTEDLIEERWARATEPVTLATSRKLYSRAAMENLTKMMRAPGAPLPFAHLPAIQAPTLVTWGRDDRVSPVDMALIPMRLIPKCELHIFYDCGHWAMIERKAEFESVTLAFLDRSRGCADRPNATLR